MTATETQGATPSPAQRRTVGEVTRSPEAESSPAGLSAASRALWVSVSSQHLLNGADQVILTEICRAKDRLDRMHALEIDGDGGLATDINQTANAMKQLIASLRLPDANTGKRPQYRGARGVYRPRTTNSAKGTR